MAMDTKLIFLCGFPSSGTDLLKNVLNAHPDVFIGGEFPFLPRLCGKYGPVVARDATGQLIADFKSLDVYHNFRNPNVTLSSTKEVYSLAEIYSQMLSSNQRKWKGNKTPQNTEHIDHLKSLFPDAKFIIIIRDIRDVALSWKSKWGKDPLLCASKWDSRMRRGHRLLQKFRSDCMVVTYESLLDEFEKTARDMCSFLEIEFHENMIEFSRHVTEVIDGKRNYGKPILIHNHGKWRKELDHSTVRRIEEIAWRSLTLFGYPIAEGRGYRPISNIEKSVGLVRDICALVLVGNRSITRNKLNSRLRTILYEFKKVFLFRSNHKVMY